MKPKHTVEDDLKELGFPYQFKVLTDPSLKMDAESEFITVLVKIPKTKVSYHFGENFECRYDCEDKELEGWLNLLSSKDYNVEITY